MFGVCDGCKRATCSDTKYQLHAEGRSHQQPPCLQFEITDDTEAVQMLQRTSQVGEFYILGPPVIPLGPNDGPTRNFLVRSAIQTLCATSSMLNCKG